MNFVLVGWAILHTLSAPLISLSTKPCSVDAIEQVCDAMDRSSALQAIIF